MVEPIRDAVTYESQHEIRLPQPLIQELFQEGERIFGEAHNGSSGDYYNDNSGHESKPRLVDKFAPLAFGDDSSRYYFVWYDDRRSTYFKEGTRGRSAAIATQEWKRASNDRFREIIYSQEDSGFYATVSEEVNNRAYLEHEQGNEQNLVPSNGRMRAKYKLTDETRRNLVEFESHRIDEVNINGVPGRWVRDLRIEVPQRNVDYRELYILNRAGLTVREQQRADIRFQIQGTVDSPENTTVTIGSGPPSFAQTLFDDPESNLRVVFYKGNEDGLAMLKQDPSFAFLNEEKPDAGEIVNLIKNRVKLLQEQWDKPQSIFTPSKELQPPALEETSVE